MTAQVLFEQRARLSAQDTPDIPLPSDINIAELGEDVFFVTLPVARANVRSRNGRFYPEKVVDQIVQQINEKRPEGRFGHIRDDERAIRYEPPAVRWLAAIKTEDGTVWAKGIPITDEARNHLRMAKATNARVATSIYGYAKKMDGDTVLEIELEAIDLADPERVGVPETVAVPIITKEQSGERQMPETRTETVETSSEAEALRNRVDELVDSRIAELEAERDELLARERRRISEMERQHKRLNRMLDEAYDTIAEMEAIITEVDPILEEMDATTELALQLYEMTKTRKPSSKVKKPKMVMDDEEDEEEEDDEDFEFGEEEDFDDEEEEDDEDLEFGEEEDFDDDEEDDDDEDLEFGEEEDFDDEEDDDDEEEMEEEWDTAKGRAKASKHKMKPGDDPEAPDAEGEPISKALKRRKPSRRAKEQFGEVAPSRILEQTIRNVDVLLREMEALLRSAVKAAVQEHVRVPSARPIIAELVMKEHPRTRAEIMDALAEVVRRRSVKRLLKSATVAEMGPAVGKAAKPKSEDGYKRYLRFEVK